MQDKDDILNSGNLMIDQEEPGMGDLADEEELSDEELEITVDNVDAFADDSDKESVPQGLESFTLSRKFVAGSYQEFKRQVHLAVTVSKNLLVQYCQ